jgi:hypothetical protein
MTDAVIVTPVGAPGAAVPAAVSATARAAGQSKGRRLRPRHLWLVPGLAVAVSASELGKQHGVGIAELIAFGIAPHLPLLLRYVGSAAGSLAVPLFNLLHHPLVALSAVVVAVGGTVNDLVPMVALVAALVWFSHIVIGWGLGDVMRHGEARR